MVALIGSLGVGSLGTIAFLGRFVGTFTVSVDNGEVALSLDEHLAFENPQSYLRINYLPPYVETTEVARLNDPAKLDNEDYDYLTGRDYSVNAQTGESKEIMYFFKYTFYVKNTGATRARYVFSLNILENKPTQETTPRYLDDTLRVMIFDHESGDDSHDYRVFAKATNKGNNYLKDGSKTNREFVADPPKGVERVESDRYPLAELFAAPDVIATYDVPDFGPNDIRRYTLVTWLEGSDPDSLGATPIGASIRLGVEINAYEN